MNNDIPLEPNDIPIELNSLHTVKAYRYMQSVVGHRTPTFNDLRIEAAFVAAAEWAWEELTTRIALRNELRRKRKKRRMAKLHNSTFEYLKPTAYQMDTMERIRAAARSFADVIEREIPDGPDKTYILRAHRQNAMWCNVAITRDADGTPRIDDGASSTMHTHE